MSSMWLLSVVKLIMHTHEAKSRTVLQENYIKQAQKQKRGSNLIKGCRIMWGSVSMLKIQRQTKSKIMSLESVASIHFLL